MHNGEKSREEATTKKKLVVSIIGLFYTLVFLIFIRINFKEVSFILSEGISYILNIGFIVEIILVTFLLIISYQSKDKVNNNSKTISNFALILIIISFMFISFILGTLV